MQHLKSKTELVLFFLKERWPYRILLLTLSLLNAVSGLSVPFLQKQFTTSNNVNDLLICTVLTLISFMCFQLTNYVGTIEALHLQNKLSGFLYKYYIHLKNMSASRTTGEKVALYTTDIPSTTMWLEQSVPYFLTTFFPLVLTPFFLYKFYNLPFHFSVFIIGLLLIFNLTLAYRQSIFFARFKLLAAERMGVVNEWIQNIRFLKTINWISRFEKRIFSKRIVETENRIQMVTNGQVMNSFSSSITFWLNLFVLMFILFFELKTPEARFKKDDIFVLFWVMGIFLSRPLRQLPWLITMFFDASTSAQRYIQAIADQQEEPQIKPQLPAQSDAQSHSTHVLDIKNLNLVLQGDFKLKNINLTLPAGQLVGLIGPVGSGKTLFMKSLLKETPFTADFFMTAPTRFLPQDPFIMSATIKENIDLKYDSDLPDQKAHEALKQAEFDLTVDRMQNSLKTEIGERGLNLSGGQKQRLSLSRVFLDPQPLILLDDPLSAVDIATEAKLLKTISQLKTSGFTFLMSSQRYHFLQNCDRILYIENGEILFDGTYTELLQNQKLKEFIQ